MLNDDVEHSVRLMNSIDHSYNHDAYCIYDHNVYYIYGAYCIYDFGYDLSICSDHFLSYNDDHFDHYNTLVQAHSRGKTRQASVKSIKVGPMTCFGVY